MHLYGAVIFTQDRNTRRIPILATWHLDPISWVQRETLQERMFTDARILAEETGYKDQVQTEDDKYVALSSSRPPEDELCGVIVTDHEYPGEAAVAVLDKILEEMAVRVPKTRYQPRIAFLASKHPDQFAPLRLNYTISQLMHKQEGIDVPILEAALEFPSAQQYLTRYQDLARAQQLADSQSKNHAVTASVPKEEVESPIKKHSLFGIRSSKWSQPHPVHPNVAPAQPVHNIRPLVHSNRHTAPIYAPEEADRNTLLSPDMLRGGPNRSPRAIPTVLPFSPLITEPTLTRQATSETLRANDPSSSAQWRNTAPVHASNVSLPVEVTQPRKRSATHTMGSSVPTTQGSALEKGRPRTGTSASAHRKGHQHRTSLVSDAEPTAKEEERHASVQASLNAVRSLAGRKTATPSAIHSDEGNDDSETETEASLPTRPPSPQSRLVAVRAALAATPNVDPQRAERIRERSKCNPCPAEPVQEMIIEKRHDFLPYISSDGDPSEPASTDKLRLPAFKKAGCKHHTVQPRVPISPPADSQPMAKKHVPSQHQSNSAPGSSTASTFANSQQPNLHETHSINGVTSSLRSLKPGRPRAATTAGSGKEDRCVVM